MSVLHPRGDKAAPTKVPLKKIERRIRARFKQYNITDYRILIYDLSDLRVVRIVTPETGLIELCSTIFDDDFTAFNKLYPRYK